MTPTFRTLAGAAALTLLALPGHAQDDAGDDQQAIEREETATPEGSGDSDGDVNQITTFEPSDFERQLFEGEGFTASDGEGVYAQVCAGCHMPEGEGAEGAGEYPALAGNPNLEFPEYAINLIVYGQKGMPAFGDMLDDQQIADVTNYIRSSFGNDYVSGDGGEATADMVSQIRPEEAVDESSQEEHE